MAWSNGLNMLVTVLNWGRLAGTWRGSLSVLDDVLPDGRQNGRPLPFCDCGVPSPGGVSGRATDVESRRILADTQLLAAAVQEYGRSATSLGRPVAGISPWGTGRCARRVLAIAPWLRRWGPTDAR